MGHKNITTTRQHVFWDSHDIILKHKEARILNNILPKKPAAENHKTSKNVYYITKTYRQENVFKMQNCTL